MTNEQFQLNKMINENKQYQVKSFINTGVSGIKNPTESEPLEIDRTVFQKTKQEKDFLKREKKKLKHENNI